MYHAKSTCTASDVGEVVYHICHPCSTCVVAYGLGKFRNFKRVFLHWPNLDGAWFLSPVQIPFLILASTKSAQPQSALDRVPSALNSRKNPEENVEEMNGMVEVCLRKPRC
jgi:hypothetical protein